MSVHEIAKLAGVSPSTVSRVINKYPNVSTASVKRVTRAMDGLGYTAQPRGRGGRRSELDCVAVLFSSRHMFDPYASTGHLILRAIEEALRERNLGMIVSGFTELDAVPEFILRGKVRGAIVRGHNPSDSFVEHLERVPHVWLASHRAKTGDVVLAGNEQISRLAAEYLLGRGHQRVGVLNILPDSAGKSRVRFFRYIIEDALGACHCYVGADGEERRLAKVSEGEFDLNWFEEQIAREVDRMLADGERPTGLFVPMDFQVAVVYSVLQQRGLRPGIDIEIIGTDNEKAALLGLYPRPATIDLGSQAVGRRAVEHLMMRIANPHYECVQVVLEPKLVPGVELRHDWAGASTDA